MYKRVLVCLDGSSTSARALRHALRIAQLRGSAVRLLHVLDRPISLGGFLADDQPPMVEAMRRRANGLLYAAVDSAAAAGITADTRLVDLGDRRLGEAVAQEATDWPADLVVVGSHGRRGVSRALLGSGAEQVLRLAPVPVLVVPAAWSAREVPVAFARILVAVDGSEASGRALTAALQLARDAGGRLRIVHQFEMLAHLTGFEHGAQVLADARAQAMTVLDAAFASAQSAAVAADVKLLDTPGRRLGEAVADEAASYAADLVVLGTTGRHGVERALLGSGAEQVIRLSATPVLAVRAGLPRPDRP